MSGGHRTAGLALLGVCAAAWLIVPGRMTAQPFPVAVLTAAQGPINPEPPVAEGYLPGTPRSGGGVVDPPIPLVTVRVRVPASGTVGQELTYRIVVENASNATAHRVAVRATLPTNAEYKRATPEAIRVTPEQDPAIKVPELRWSFGTLAARATKEISVVVVPDGGGEVKMTGWVSFEHGQTVVTRLNQPTLRVRKTGPAEAAVNAPINFVVEVINDGSATAEGIVVTDTLPEGLKFSTNVTQPGPKGDNPLLWELGSIPAGQTRRLEYTVIPEKPGEFTNSVKVTAKGNLSETARSTVKVGQPKVTIGKTGPKLGVPGQALVYAITVTNTGGIAASNVQILEIIPQDRLPGSQVMVVDYLSSTEGGRYEQGAVRWALGTLAAGAARTVQLTVRVNQPGTLELVSEAKADQNQPEKAGSLTCVVNPKNRVTLFMNKARAPLEVGREAVYTVRVINSANDPIDNVALTVSSAADNVSFVKSSGPTNEVSKQETQVQFAPLTRLQPGQIEEYLITVKPLRPGEADLRANANVTPPQAGFPVLIKSTASILPPRP